MIKIFETEEELAEVIAREMREELTKEKSPVFCLASGGTPRKSYKKFIEQCKEDRDIKNARFISLDEWVGIEKTKVGSCYQMLYEDLFKDLELEDGQITFYETVDTDLDKECRRIDSFLETHPITYSLMGVGMNGHIGLNEPGDEVRNYSSIVALSETTKNVAQKYFLEKTVLEDGITLGLQQVMNSKRVVVVITGSHKKEIVKQIVENAEADLPAQKLLGQKHIDFYFDREAAMLLTNN